MTTPIGIFLQKIESFASMKGGQKPSDVQLVDGKFSVDGNVKLDENNLINVEKLEQDVEQGDTTEPLKPAKTSFWRSIVNFFTGKRDYEVNGEKVTLPKNKVLYNIDGSTIIADKGSGSISKNKDEVLVITGFENADIKLGDNQKIDITKLGDESKVTIGKNSTVIADGYTINLPNGGTAAVDPGSSSAFSYIVAQNNEDGTTSYVNITDYDKDGKTDRLYYSMVNGENLNASDYNNTYGNELRYLGRDYDADAKIDDKLVTYKYKGDNYNSSLTLRDTNNDGVVDRFEADTNVYNDDGTKSSYFNIEDYKADGNINDVYQVKYYENDHRPEDWNENTLAGMSSEDSRLTKYYDQVTTKTKLDEEGNKTSEEIIVETEKGTHLQASSTKIEYKDGEVVSETTENWQEYNQGERANQQFEEIITNEDGSVTKNISYDTDGDGKIDTKIQIDIDEKGVQTTKKTHDFDGDSVFE